MYSTVRYHLTMPQKRTTISMDEIIYDLIAVKLGFTSAAKETHAAVRKQLEKLILPYYDPKSLHYHIHCINYNPTQFVTKEVIFWLIGEELERKYYEYTINSRKR